MEFCGNFVTCEKTRLAEPPRVVAQGDLLGESEGVEFLVPDFREGEVESARGISVPEGGGFLNRQGECYKSALCLDQQVIRAAKILNGSSLPQGGGVALFQVAPNRSIENRGVPINILLAQGCRVRAS